MTTEQILSHIREVCGLIKELPAIVPVDNDIYFEKTEVISFSIHLEHLLYAFKDRYIGINTDGEILVFIDHLHNETTHEHVANYDLTRTVEQNLTDNTELRELIISLIK